MICARISLTPARPTDVVRPGVVDLSTYNACNSRLVCTPLTNQSLLCQPEICSLTHRASAWRIAMATSSPQSPPPRPQQRTHGAKERFESDANIHNFAPVARIMKTALPENAKIAKEAKECMQECVSEFISFITSEGTSRLIRRSCTCGASTNTSRSIRKVSTGEAQDGQWRGYSLRHDIAGFRELRRGTQDLPRQVSRGELPPNSEPLTLFTKYIMFTL